MDTSSPYLSLDLLNHVLHFHYIPISQPNLFLFQLFMIFTETHTRPFLVLLCVFFFFSFFSFFSHIIMPSFFSSTTTFLSDVTSSFSKHKPHDCVSVTLSSCLSFPLLILQSPAPVPLSPAVTAAERHPYPFLGFQRLM